MKRTILSKSPFVIMFLASLFVRSPPVFPQQADESSRPLVILTALASPAGDTVARTLASTMTSSIELMLRLTGTVTLKRADFLSPNTSLDRVIPYYDEHNAAEAVYGSVTPTGNGAYAVALDVWNASHPNGKATVMKRTISNVLSSFALADEMSLRVASTIVGKRLQEGTLLVRNVSGLAKFSVYANGHLLGRNRTSFRILTGAWTVVVAKPGEVGDVPVQSFHVDIEKGKTAKVSLSKTPARGAALVRKAGEAHRSKEASSKSTGSGANGQPPVLKVSPATGSISITTATAGALYLGGRMIGHVPAGRATLSRVRAGVRHLAMRYADGHVERKEIRVRAGGTTDAMLTYRKGSAGSKWAEHSLPNSRDWSSVTYGNGTFVAVAAYSKVVATSTGGADWTEASLPGSRNWQSISYGNGTFVVVAPGNVVATSSDGAGWTLHAMPSSQDWRSVTFGNGTFLAVAYSSNIVATSNDGINWTEGSLPASRDWQSVAYGNHTFVAVANGLFGSNAVATSHDGVHWTEGSLPSTTEWQSVTYGNGTFLAVVWKSNLTATSRSGRTWTKGSLPSSQNWSSVTYGNGTFLAVAADSDVAAISRDGINWTEASLPSSRNWTSVTYGNGTFLAITAYGHAAATSP